MQLATKLFYAQQKGRVGTIMGNYGHLSPTPQPVPHVSGKAAEANLRQSYGHSHILEHSTKYRERTPEPHVKGVPAHDNYDNGLGRSVQRLFYQYGKLPETRRTEPKVKYGGVQNFENAQGRSMQKILSQCPPSHRYLERPQSVPV